MIDRASILADQRVLAQLRADYIPVAIDQANQRRQKDTEGDFYRKIASQGPRNDFRNGTTQGFYLASPDGNLLAYTNHRGPDRMLRTLRTANARAVKEAEPVERTRTDKRYAFTAPEGSAVVRVNGKVLGGYDEARNRHEAIMRSAISRDNFWITADEQKVLAAGTIPQAMQSRLLRYHLVDNTRGEPPMWRSGEIRNAGLRLKDGLLTGRVRFATKSGDRTYDAVLRGHLEFKGTKLTRFDLVASGTFKGEGRYTRNAPKKPFPYAVTFRLADMKDIADGVAPQAARGWLDGYLHPERN